VNTPESLQRFFTHYAELSMGPRPEDLAALYAPTFIVGGPQGSRAFANDSKFVDWLRQVGTFNRQHGMNSMTPVAILEVMLSPMHSLATVMWGAQFEKTGQRVIQFDISYVLERAGEGWQVLSYISQSDQNEAMRKEGLL
jgi:hypothetical protein